MSRPLATPKPLPTKQYLDEILRYECETGRLFWRTRDVSSFNGDDGISPHVKCFQWNNIRAGKEAGGMQNGGYMRVMIDGLAHMQHRVIWKMEMGEDPIQIDHINGDKSDNRIANLRNVTQQINLKNKKLYTSNSSGIPGVRFHERDKVWCAKIGVGEGKELQLGSYSTREEAIAARLAVQTLLDYHENHGRSLRGEI